MESLRVSGLLSTLALVLAPVAVQATTVRGSAADAAPADQSLRPSGKGYGVPERRVNRPAMPKAPAVNNGITYHGGPVMNSAGGINVYLLWYGDWATQSPTGKSIVTDMLSNVTGTPYFNINTSYYTSATNAATRVRNIVNLLGQADDTAKSLGSSLSDAAILTLVSSAIAAGKFPSDPNAVYFVLTSKDVTASSGFCSSYCGWHTHATIGGKDIKYSFVGDAARCPSSCAAQSVSSPNNNPGVDGMASVLMHELEEAATDPDLNAWYDTRSNENADKCAWKFGTTSLAANGSKYNVTWGARQFLIQQNWANDFGGKCVMSY